MQTDSARNQEVLSNIPDGKFIGYFAQEGIQLSMLNQRTEKDQDGENVSQKMELKFFIYMVIIFFALPLAIIQIPGVEKVGEAIISPFMKIIESGQ